jgi:hypothetical protein
VHGHDLTLGSGSVDGIIGAQVFANWGRLFANAFIQYMARNEGAFDYRFANDLLFAAGPGAYLLTGDSLFGEPYTLRAQALFSGETKGNDSIRSDKRPSVINGALPRPRVRLRLGDAPRRRGERRPAGPAEQHFATDRPRLPPARRIQLACLTALRSHT